MTVKHKPPVPVALVCPAPPGDSGWGGIGFRDFLPASIGEGPSAWSHTQTCVPAGLVFAVRDGLGVNVTL